MTIFTRDLALHRERLIKLVQFAAEHDKDGDKVDGAFVNYFTRTCDGKLTRSELEDLTLMVQEQVRLSVYTTEQAAAWCGMGIDHIREGIWKGGTLRSAKPGHDRYIEHDDLVEWLHERG